MIKFMETIKRKEGMTVEEFSRHWKEVHGPLVAKHLPGVRKYVQNHPVKLGRGEPAIDGIVEVWFDDVEAFRKASAFYRSDQGKVIRDDEERFLDNSKTVSFVAEEVSIK